MSLLIKDKKTGKILYAIAYEKWTTPKKSGMMYLHAIDYMDAYRQLIASWRAKAFDLSTRVVCIAPAIGGFVKAEDKPIRVYGGL